MADLRKLLNRLSEAEGKLRAQRFLAPCVRGGQLRASVAGLLYTFTPQPPDFEGWGIFQPADEKSARLVEEASLARVGAYLHLFPALRLRLADRLRGSAWLAYPVNESDMRQRFPAQQVRPLPVHLVTEGQQFEQVVARHIGGAWFFEELDRRASPLDAERLREAVRAGLAPEALSWKGFVPEMRTCYSLVFRRDELEREQKPHRAERHRQTRDERRLREALRFGGGDLHSFFDRGDCWVVEWTTHDGQLHTSAIAKNDLTVMSAGICLSGEDEKFDLQSLVGVVEGDWT